MDPVLTAAIPLTDSTIPNILGAVERSIQRMKLGDFAMPVIGFAVATSSISFELNLR
jgi:hypothetical protein